MNNIYSQGGWNIGYRPIQMIKKKSTLIGKEVRFDFKKTSSDVVTNVFKSGRLLLSREDSIELNVLDKNILFKEVWKIHSDWGFVKEQYLESISSPKIKLKDMTLLKVSSKSITTSALLILPEGTKRIKLVVEKKKVKGILFKESY